MNELARLPEDVRLKLLVKSIEFIEFIATQDHHLSMEDIEYDADIFLSRVEEIVNAHPPTTKN